MAVYRYSGIKALYGIMSMWYYVPRPVTKRVHWVQLHHQLHRQLHHHPVVPLALRFAPYVLRV